jgi:glycogen debranching enzyme
VALEWTPNVASGTSITLVEGASFLVSDRGGDILAGQAHGLFYRNARLLSSLQVTVNGETPEPLSAVSEEPFTATFVGRVRPASGATSSTILVVRHRYLGQGLREDIVIRNFAEEAAYCEVDVHFDVDLAGLAEVRDRRVGPSRAIGEVTDEGVRFQARRGDTRRGARVSLCGAPELSATVASFETIVAAKGEWSTCVQVSPVIDAEELVPRYRCGDPVERSMPSDRLERWRKGVPSIITDNDDLGRTVLRSAEDLGALRIFDPEFPERVVIAAGAPWSMTFYGRDSLLTAWMALLADPDLALGVLETLARFQGKVEDPRTEEQPGRILHELRFGARSPLSLDGGDVSYCSIDATPLFVMLLGELRRWGLAPEVVERLLPHADAALAWIEQYGDRDGDGYVEYQRASDRGLVHQGWKDSPRALRGADGREVVPPVALCEVQGYVYAAYLARAHFATELGDEALATKLRQRAADLKARFNRDFWSDEHGWLVLGLDADKAPIDVLASNAGHCLWTGIVDEEKAAAMAEHLVGPKLFSGYGIRTLADGMPGYNPLSYHNGSVWPHDNAIAAAGLMRYGHVDAAHKVILAQLDAAADFGHRLPELFSGLKRSEFRQPVGFPSACSPQAWSAAAPLLFLRTLLRFEPWAPRGKLWMAPCLPESIRRVRLERIPLLGGRLTVDVDGDDVSTDGLPSGIELVAEPRRPLSAYSSAAAAGAAAASGGGAGGDPGGGGGGRGR